MGGPDVPWPHKASEVPMHREFEEMNKQVEFMRVTDIFIVSGDADVIRLSSYNGVVIASVSGGCQY